MKAAHIREHGALEQLQVGDVPDPQPGPGEVLVEIKAAALNHLDIWVRQGGRRQLPMPHVLGSDGAGVVAEVGEGVEGLAVGDEVVLYPGLHCGHCRHCLHGEHSLCEDFGIVGLSRWGAFAERLVVPAYTLFPKPGFLDWPAAAGLTLDHLTAWRMLFTRGQLQPGQRVLIHGIGGGVALAALQLAKAAGAEAIVTSSSNEKLSRAVDLGADHTVNYRMEADSLADDIFQMTDGAGVDLVIDAVGAATFALNLQVLRRGARAVFCGVTTGSEATADIRAIYWNQLSVLGSTLGSLGECHDLLRAVEVNRIEPVVDQAAALEDVRRLMGRMENNEQFGKLVLTLES